MKLCRYDNDNLGLVEGDRIRDISAVRAELPTMRWPLPLGDPLAARLPKLISAIHDLTLTTPVIPLHQVRLHAPIANPSKIIGAPVNYAKHVEESRADREIHAGKPILPIHEAGLFLKANSALAGPSDGVRLGMPERRTDHEVELCVVVGRHGRNIPKDRALDYVLGYCIGLDLTVRGPEERSYRKSLDGYAVTGPWLTTRDEIPDPNSLDIKLWVNDELRQSANTRQMLLDVPGLIEYASAAYTLYPGDLLMTGTPEGVGPVVPGDLLRAQIEGIGTMEVKIHWSTTGTTATATPPPLEKPQR